MPSLISTLIQTQKSATRAEIGTVSSRNSDGSYNIRIGGRTIRARSVLSAGITAGSKVVTVKTSEERYIIGKDHIRKKGQITIPVD